MIEFILFQNSPIINNRNYSWIFRQLLWCHQGITKPIDYRESFNFFYYNILNFTHSIANFHTKLIVDIETQFAVLLGIIFILELAVGIAACLFKADLDDILKDSLQKSISRSSRDDMIAWDKAQSRMMCCGITGPYDWTDGRQGARIPASCCIPSQNSRQAVDCADSPAHYVDKYYSVQYQMFFSIFRATS